MDPDAPEDAVQREAVLVVRLWSDGRFPEGLRARITRTLDVGVGDEDVTVTADVDEILDTVRRWLAAYLAN